MPNNQLKILLGPVKNNSSVGKAADSLGIKCFSDSDAGIVYNIETDSFQDILNRLPAGWQPDIVIFWAPEYNSIPLGLEKAPCTTIAVVGDWNLGFYAIKENLKKFDWIVTDKAGVEVFKRAGYRNIDYWPMFSFDPDLHKVLPDIKKIYDIVFIGNFNHMIHSERAGWLSRVSKLGSRYNVKLLSGIYGEEYARVLNQAKIVFNHSVRQEMNMRAYEAPACGSMLFIEESNLEVRDFFTDKQECVIYNSENFEQLIDYYLQNDAERERITLAGLQKVQRETHRDHLLRLIGLIREKNLKDIKKAKRPFSSLSFNTQAYHNSLTAIQGVTKGSLPLAGKVIAGGLDKTSGDPDLLNALVVLYATTALLLAEDQKKLLLNKSLAILENVLKTSPDAVLLYFNQANIHLHLNSKDKARNSFLKIIELLNSGKDLFKNCYDLYFPRSYDNFRVEWEKISAYYCSQPELRNDKYMKLLEWQSNQSLGDISLEYGDYLEASDYYSRAQVSFPDLTSKAGIIKALSLNKSGRTQEAVEAFYQVVEANPLQFESYFYLAELLYELKQYEECLRISRETLVIISSIPSFEQYRPFFELYLNNSLKALTGAGPVKFQKNV
jgi:tetratricopeptide (TPR) repeat protein